MLFHAILGSHATHASGSGSGEQLVDGLTVAITETSSPSSGNDYGLGETLSWNVVVTNTGNALQGVVLQVTGKASETFSLVRQGTAVFQFSKTVTASEINAQNGITITATATHSGLNLTASDSFSATTVDPFVQLSMAFAEVNPLPSGELYDAGDSASWTFTITNVGSLDISGASLSILCNGNELYSSNSYAINSGASDFKSGSYTITVPDAGSGALDFSAVFQEAPENGVEKPAVKTYFAITNLNTDVDISWRFIVKTTLPAASNTITGVPIRFYNQTGKEVEIDWGDNNTTTLNPSSFTNTDSSAALHTYASASTYTVTITAPASMWQNIYLMSNSAHNATASNWNAKTLPIYWFRMTLQEVLDPLPHIGGVQLFTATKPGNTTEGTLTAHSFAYLFYSSNLATIPDRLFAMNSDATSFQGTFYNSKLAGPIPLNTFYNCTVATSYDHCFYGSKVTTAASGIFNWAEGVLDFSYLFYGSTLATMGAGLFANSPYVTSFWSAWKNCTQLQAIPANLFAHTPLVTNFQSSFSTCSKITSIAGDAFESCTGALDFQQCFEKCTALTAVPQGLFTNCTEVTNFKSVFISSTKIATVPDDLFQYNTKVTSMETVFSGCSALGGFDFVIGSPSVSIATTFCPKKTTVTRTVTVPANSTTETTFNGVASACGLTVIQAS